MWLGCVIDTPNVSINGYRQILRWLPVDTQNVVQIENLGFHFARKVIIVDWARHGNPR
jgi:hypothetical protein